MPLLAPVMMMFFISFELSMNKGLETFTNK